MKEDQMMRKSISSVSGEMELNQNRGKKNKKSRNDDSRFLITVNVMGSAGPLRFLVNKDEMVIGVIGAALKMYAREGRLPVLGSDAENFLLYPANVGADALNALDKIGSSGMRNFLMCRKAVERPTMTAGRPDMISNKGNGSWKAWFNRSFSLKILSAQLPKTY